MNSIGLSVQEKKFKIDFLDGGHGGHLGIPNGMILVLFDLKVTLILPTKFRVSLPFGSGEVQKQIFKMAAILDFRSEHF